MFSRQIPLLDDGQQNVIRQQAVMREEKARHKAEIKRLAKQLGEAKTELQRIEEETRNALAKANEASTGPVDFSGLQ